MSKNKTKVRKGRTPRQEYYHSIFQALIDIGINNKRLPKRLLESIDAVADYVGDVAMGRRR